MEELERIGSAEELEIASRRSNGTLSKPAPIWVVRVGDDLYVRSYKGQDGAWFRAAQSSGEGWVRAGGVAKEVTFVNETAPHLNDRIDAAYNVKYGRFPQYVAPMLTAEVRATTLKLVPRTNDKEGK
jgi:hypothetical protein